MRVHGATLDEEAHVTRAAVGEQRGEVAERRRVEGDALGVGSAVGVMVRVGVGVGVGVRGRGRGWG